MSKISSEKKQNCSTHTVCQLFSFLSSFLEATSCLYLNWLSNLAHQRCPRSFASLTSFVIIANVFSFSFSLGEKPAVLDWLSNQKIDLVINVPDNLSRKERTNGYQIRRTAVDFSIPIFTNIKSAVLFVNAIDRIDVEKMEVRSWNEYREMTAI